MDSIYCGMRCQNEAVRGEEMDQGEEMLPQKELSNEEVDKEERNKGEKKLQLK